MTMTVRVLISGMVQGVGFRQFVKKEALHRGLVGYVHNLSDGRVEAVLQGEKALIDDMLTRCQTGPFLAQVKNIASEEIEDKLYTSFTIAH